MTSLKIIRKIMATPARVFEAFIDPDKIALWWGPDAGPVTEARVDPRKGGRFLVRFQMEDGSEHAASGTIETFDPPYRLVMSWRWENEESPPSRVEVSFRPVDGGTELTFVHAQLADDAARDSHTAGWNGALDKLEAKAGQL